MLNISGTVEEIIGSIVAINRRTRNKLPIIKISRKNNKRQIILMTTVILAVYM